jgi:hypothetical protein
MHVARRKPDGTFTYGERIYRLEEREPDHFAVLRASDGEVLGHLQFLLGGKSEARVEGTLRSGEEGVLQAIRSLLEGARGILPLQ